ncbi:FecR family protein [Chitinophaga arvensicola]|uniref:FecR protein n=1 Tax=Chitinophaga arvensicola TaxID=29529 RepID=A0A1I0RA62_9BACT|nr:FecR family protein [Chitinophaga arvensicola]SEW37607.1 protein of unknown function [Chitinophaga arvensicola]
MEHSTRLQYLMERLTAHTATEEELDELIGLVDNDTTSGSIDEVDAWLEAQHTQQLPVYDAARWRKVADDILGSDKLFPEPVTKSAGRVHILHRWGWAAAIVLLLGAGTWLFRSYHQSKPAVMAINSPQLDVDPGKNGAILTLADGSQLVLDSLGNGVVSRQNGTSIVLQSSTLQYSPGGATNNATEYNTITTPKGRQFEVILPDGTKVWLNAGSALQFPVAFNGKEREVQLNGEAFFEVAPRAAQPFKVKVRQQLSVEVLGTSFNVNAYTNERHIATTLIEGAVRVSLTNESGRTLVLKPGQQVQATAESMEMISGAAVEKAIAWKNGLFNFEGVGLREMMRQLERWYNLEVVYEGNVPDVKFFGEMSRSLKLADILTGLERSDVHFRLEAGRRLVVMP